MDKLDKARFSRLQKNWDQMGELDPMWAILTRAEKKGNKWEKEPFFLSGIHEIDRVLDYAKTLNIPLSNGRALDFGCGLGRLSQALAQHFQSVDGVDVAQSMIEQARELNAFPDRVTYHLNGNPDLSLFPDDHFDFIYSNITLQHIPPPFARRYIMEFIRVLQPKGLLIFQMPSAIRDRTPEGRFSLRGYLAKTVYALNLDQLYRRMKYLNQPIMEMNLLPKSEVLDMLENQGAIALDVLPDQSAGPLIESYRYSVTK